MNTPSRWLYGLILVLAFAVIGFVLGVYIGGSCCVSSGAGLAGGAIVVGYGLMGSVAASIGAVLTARLLPSRRLRPVTLVTGVIGGVLAGVLINIYLDSRAATAEFMQQSYENMLKFHVEVAVTELPTNDSSPAYPFDSVELDWRTRSVAAVVDGESCSSELAGEDAAAMLSALRGVEGVVYRDPFPCAGTLGAVQQTLTMQIAEATGQPSTADLALTEACLESHPELAKPARVAADVVKRVEWPADCGW